MVWGDLVAGNTRLDKEIPPLGSEASMNFIPLFLLFPVPPWGVLTLTLWGSVPPSLLDNHSSAEVAPRATNTSGF